MMCVIGDHHLCKEAWRFHAKSLLQWTFHKKTYVLWQNINFINEKYEEPKDGLFSNATQAILDSLKSPSDDEKPDYETDLSINDAET